MYKILTIFLLLFVGCSNTIPNPKTYTVYTPLKTYTNTVWKEQAFESDYAYFHLPDGREVIISRPFVIEEEPCTK